MVEDDRPIDEQPSGGETAKEQVYRRRIGISLAALAMLGAWISVLATNAGTNESNTAREATRLASEAQTADVLAKGVSTGLEQIDTEIALLPSRSAFRSAEELAADLGATTDPQLAEQRLVDAQAELATALGSENVRPDELAIEARRLSLEQAVVVRQRVEWNAYASQYETVLTVLAVAIFLVGFTLVLGRRLRPPVAVPGLILAVICAGWAIQIYLKPSTEVSATAIEATAAGDHDLAEGRATDAVAQYDEALASTPDYFEALKGRALATMLVANPDLLATAAFTDTSQATTNAAGADIEAAIDSGGETDASVLAVASIVALADGDWDLAAARIEEGIELNEVAAELYLWRSAVAVAQGDEVAARAWLQDAVDRFGDLGEQRSRDLAAQYLSLLELVARREPDQARLAGELTELGVATLTRNQVGRELVGGAAADAAITGATATYADGRTDVGIDLSGVAEDDTIALVGYERPAQDAPWVQPPELFFVGPASEGEGVSIPTPRNCIALGYRFDLYVEGELRDSVETPGDTGTC